GTLSVTDPDAGEAAFQPPTAEALAGSYGAFSFDPLSGAWSYQLDSVKSNTLTAGQVVRDTLSVTSVDGTANQLIDVTVTGSNDAASISGTATGAVVEDGVAMPSGTLSVTDPDTGEAAFQAPAAEALAGTYGAFSFDPATGAWRYALDAAKANMLAAGQEVHDTIAVTSLDGTASQTIDVTITGTNDVPVISSPAQVGAVTENLAPSVSGQVTATDADANAVLAYSGNASGAYGTFSVEAATGQWIYTLDSKAEPLAAGETKQETFSVTVTDDQGAVTSQQVTITVTGTDDAAILSSAIVNLVEGDAAAAISTSGQLTISDIDSPSSFVAQSDALGQYGTFSIDASGAWTYTASSAHDEFVAGQTYTDTFAVTATDGTATSVTINILGTNDAAVLRATVAGLTEADTAEAISTSGQLTISDVDSPASFVPQVDAAGAYGTFSIDANGAWTYTASSAHDEFAAGQTYTDTFTVTSADGTATSVTINITGTNDAAVLTPAVAALTEADAAAAISTTGQLSISDVDSPATFIAQSDVSGSFGTFAIDASGAWTYTSSSAHDEFAAGQIYTDTFAVTSADGTATSVTIAITGTNDSPVVSGPVAGTAVEEGAPVTLDALAHASDVDSAALSVTGLPAELPAGVSFDAEKHSFTLDPTNAAYQHLPNGQTVPVTVDYLVSDGTTTTPASVSWTVTAVNHAPVVTGVVTGAAIEGGLISTLDALANASDPD
ncbi:MAG TPA: VCBS domain-containing protein, partial [Mycobacterium sp.]|nr:VCBS domain-containing protein [Mycobacterium sp.]